MTRGTTKRRDVSRRERGRWVRTRLAPRTFMGVLAALLAFASTVGCTGFPGFTDPQGPRRSGSFARPEPTVGLRIVTFNIEYGEHIEQAAREILADPELSRADIVTVQEVSGAEAERLARLLAMNFVYYPGTLREGDEFGNAILARHAIKRDFKLVLPHPNRLGGGIRIAVGAELALGDGSFLVYSIHNETFVVSPHARLDQVKAVLDDAARRNLPAIVAGDFNTMDRWSRANTVRLFREAGYVHASRNSGTTAYPMHGPVGVVLDHIFARGFSVVSAGTRPAHSSDHVPLYAELSAQPAAEPGPARAEGPQPWGVREAR